MVQIQSRWLPNLLLAAWLAGPANWPLWRALWDLTEVSGWRGLGFLVGHALMLAGVLFALLSLITWRWVWRPAALALLLTAAIAAYYMASYGVVIDRGMMHNVLGTDPREVWDLLSWRALVWLIVLAGLPGWWWWRTAGQAIPRGVWGGVWRNVLGALLGLAVATMALWLVYQDFASVTRNHRQLRWMMSPLNVLVASVQVARAAWPQRALPLQRVGTDATLGPSYSNGARPLALVLVVGETSRAANWQLSGYPRATTPRLKQLVQQGEAVYFNQVMSCGTSTAVSLPCMFSLQTHERFDGAPSEGLLDVLQRAGLAVMWLDNQSGCKGACDRVPTVHTRALDNPRWCANGECRDEVMLDDLAKRMAQLPAAARATGVVLVLHQMGSHGPAYDKRVDPAFKRFLPECTSNALQACARQELVNAYDNTVLYTDHFVAQTVQWLSQQTAYDTALLYVSDHGESLGENNLYLHGLPYALAPREQKHVPMLAWASPAWRQRMGLNTACATKQAQRPWSHDNFFHTVLGLADVHTQAYQGALDAWGPCYTDKPTMAPMASLTQ